MANCHWWPVVGWLWDWLVSWQTTMSTLRLETAGACLTARVNLRADELRTAVALFAVLFDSVATARLVRLEAGRFGLENRVDLLF